MPVQSQFVQQKLGNGEMQLPRMANLLVDLPDACQAEVCETLLEQGVLRLERIVSRGQSTPEGQWYDQDHDEWVLVIAGQALLQIAGEQVARRLETGDWVYLPAHCRHRVVWTPPDRETIWLALHWKENREVPWCR